MQHHATPESRGNLPRGSFSPRHHKKIMRQQALRQQVQRLFHGKTDADSANNPISLKR